jgi:hypothetical protein
MDGSIYVEANIGYYGLLDITPQVFKNHRAIYLIRDGRDWVRSHMNWGEMYGKSNFRKLVSHTWPTASEIKDDPYREEWQTMSRFEKLCWAWTRLNSYALATVARNPDARLFHFEEIFLGKNKYLVLDDLVAFSTALLGIDKKELGNTSGWLEKITHKGSNEFPDWNEWNKEYKTQFETICGSLMEKLGYCI